MILSFMWYEMPPTPQDRHYRNHLSTSPLHRQSPPIDNHNHPSVVDIVEDAVTVNAVIFAIVNISTGLIVGVSPRSDNVGTGFRAILGWRWMSLLEWLGELRCVTGFTNVYNVTTTKGSTDHRPRALRHPFLYCLQRHLPHHHHSLHHHTYF